MEGFLFFLDWEWEEWEVVVAETYRLVGENSVQGWGDLMGLPMGASGRVGEDDLGVIQRWIEEQLGASFEEVRGDDHTRTASDAWFDKMMNFEVEHNAIVRYRNNMWWEMDGYSEEEKEAKFNELLFKWLRSEFLFFLAENGCGKHLEVQPEYAYVLDFVDSEPQMRQIDIRQFGEHAKSFVRANEVVGNGLIDMYMAMGKRRKGSVGWVISPMEIYLKYGSGTDVINVNYGRENESGELVVDGQYWMFNRVLSQEQRRFLHNTVKMLGSLNNVPLRDLDKNELVLNVPTNILMIDGDGKNFSEPEMLVRNPGVFSVSGVVDLGELREFVSELFELKFGERLFDEVELSMYEMIHQLVESYLPLLYEKLWVDKDRVGYLEVLRVMQGHCQAIYSLKKAERQGIDLVAARLFMGQHLNDVYNGGFSVGWVGDAVMSLTDTTTGIDSSTPMGFEETREKTKYCKKHECYFDGDKCPKCENKSEYHAHL